MRITRPRATKLSQITIDTDLAMGAHNITLGAAQTVDGKDVSTLGSAVANTGNYTGNATNDRAIEHGLGVIPKFVLFREQLGTNDIVAILDKISPLVGGTEHTVLYPTTTYFYVGSAGAFTPTANADGQEYFWVAVG